MSSKQSSASASSSRNPSPAPNTPQIDPYRTISSHLKRPLAPLLPQTEPLLPNLLSLNASVYSSRLSGKTLLTTPDQLSTTSSVLVQGRKRNRGNECEKKKAREEHERNVKTRERLGLEGMRKVKKRLGSVVGKGKRISYNALIPLNHLHINYLCQLLALPPLPSPVPNTLPPLNPEPLQSKISKADFTGIYLTVLAAKNDDLKDQRGIVIEETAETFRLVGQDDKVRVIPKSGSLFRLSFPAYSPRSNLDDESPFPPDLTGHLDTCPRLEMDLLGSAFAYRSADRAGRKFRPAQGGGGGSGWGEGWVGGVGGMGKMLNEMEATVGGKWSVREKVSGGKRKRNKFRRKDPPAWGNPAA
ncbi:ribonuclease P protein subunit POP4 [Cryptococcus neoformans Ze90-1]|nr:ribonuclease P protein subunit POP4 [Cryptococcus neoformans var. grubii Ze90-1]